MKLTKRVLFTIIGLFFYSLLAVASFNGKSTEDLKNKIPKLTPADVYLSLEKEGFTTKKSFSKDNGNLYQCTKKQAGIDYHVGVFSFGSSDVETVSGTATLEDTVNKNILATKSFIKFVGSIPYEGSNPKMIYEWIDKNFNNDKSTITVSGVAFTIYAPSKFVRMIEAKRVE